VAVTVKLSSYGIRGPWVVDNCMGCGKKRSCLQFTIPDGPDGWSYEYLCVMCLIKDIEAWQSESVEGREPYGPV
jgi:hypothetical protein